jgi:hypothetical protein
LDRRPIRRAGAAFLLLTLSAVVQAAEQGMKDGAADNSSAANAESEVPNASGQSEQPTGSIELKRDFTNHTNDPEESSGTTLRATGSLDGPVSLLRLDVPFQDRKPGFGGSFSGALLGDIKTRIGFRAVPIAGVPTAFLFEVIFPTAVSRAGGNGKYQLGPGLQTSVPVRVLDILPAAHELTFMPLVQQIVSVAGDETRKDVNYTKIELALKDIWRGEYWLKLTTKPVVDWTQNAKSGAVIELESGVIINPRWTSWLLVGNRLWGEKVPSTYNTRIEAGVTRQF